MKYANIITNTDLVNHEEVDYINYIKEPLSYNEIKNGLPTLYVGWQFLNQTNSINDFLENLNILNKTIIKNGLYWECSYEENKSEHIFGVNNFVTYIPYIFFSSRYEYINVSVLFNSKKIDDLFVFVDVVYLYKNEMLYVLVKNKIFGFDLRLHNFLGYDTNKILDHLKNNCKYFYDDLNGNLFKKHFGGLVLSYKLKKYMPVKLNKI